MYIEISEMFKNHITVIEKYFIEIHIDIELLSSPTLNLYDPMPSPLAPALTRLLRQRLPFTINHSPYI